MQCVQIPVAKTVEYSIHSITGLTEVARKWNYIQIYHSNGTFVVKKLMQSQIEIIRHRYLLICPKCDKIK